MRKTAADDNLTCMIFFFSRRSVFLEYWKGPDFYVVCLVGKQIGQIVSGRLEPGSFLL